MAVFLAIYQSQSKYGRLVLPEKPFLNLYGLFLWMGFNCFNCSTGSTMLGSQDKDTTYFLPLSLQEYLVLISSALKDERLSQPWVNPASGFQPETPRLGIQHLNP